jgi:hypothetical protein
VTGSSALSPYQRLLVSDVTAMTSFTVGVDNHLVVVTSGGCLHVYRLVAGEVSLFPQLLNSHEIKFIFTIYLHSVYNLYN